MGEGDSNSTLMTQILEKLNGLQSSLDSNCEETRTIRDDVKKIIKSNKVMSTHVSEIKKDNEKMKKSIDILERDKRRKNLLIRGIEEKDGETMKDIENTLLECFQNKMKLDIQLFEIDFIKKIKNPDKEKKRLLIVTLTTLRRKMEIIQNCKLLKDTQISIQEDFSKDVAQTRKTLYPIMKQMREQQKHAVIRYDKLYVDGQPWIPEETNNAKRKPSLSPNMDLPTDTARNGRFTKKTKKQPSKSQAGIPHTSRTAGPRKGNGRLSSATPSARSEDEDGMEYNTDEAEFEDLEMKTPPTPTPTGQKNY